MGEDGWLGVGWPTEWGGRGFTPVEQFLWFDEAMRAGAPVPMLTINTVGPTIMRFGSDEQKEFFLPKVLKGEIHFCIGYSEPGAGTDLAALRTRADRDGDEYVINGQKMWTSLASDADYIWLAVRTNQEAKKHKGISLFVIPMDTPGIKVVPIHVMGESNINQTFFEDVRVPASMRVGEENAGWQIITNQLNHERVTLCSSGIVERSLNDVREWAQQTNLPDGRRVIDQEWVQINLARVHARLEFLRLINWKIASASTKGSLHPADASSTKVFGTEFYLEAFRLLMEIMGERGVPQGRRARRRALGPARTPVPRAHHPHLRRWHERDPARPHRGVRSRHAPRPRVEDSQPHLTSERRKRRASGHEVGRTCEELCPTQRASEAIDMDFDFTKSSRTCRTSRSRSSRASSRTSVCARSTPAATDSTASSGRKLAAAGLLGVAVPEAQGGLGYGFLEAALVLEQVGRTVAPVPYLATVGARRTSDRTVRLRRAAATRGSPAWRAVRRVLTAALVEFGADPLAPQTTATRDGDGWVLDGQKDCVPAGMVADVRRWCRRRPADGGVVLALVDPSAARRARGIVRTRPTSSPRRG